MGPAHNVLSWQEIDHCVLLLREALQGRQFDEVVGISRAGLIASVLLAHALSIRTMSVIEMQITTEDGTDAPKLDDVRVIRLPDPQRIRDRRILLADDIVGSGKTMATARSLLLGELGAAALTSCALVVNEANLTMPLKSVCDYVGCRVRGWTVFPWEHISAAGLEGLR